MKIILLYCTSTWPTVRLGRARTRNLRYCSSTVNIYLVRPYTPRNQHFQLIPTVNCNIDGFKVFISNCSLELSMPITITVTIDSCVGLDREISESYTSCACHSPTLSKMGGCTRSEPPRALRFTAAPCTLQRRVVVQNTCVIFS